jgi:hypothetical protein
MTTATHCDLTEIPAWIYVRGRGNSRIRATLAPLHARWYIVSDYCVSLSLEDTERAKELRALMQEHELFVLLTSGHSSCDFRVTHLEG